MYVLLFKLKTATKMSRRYKSILVSSPCDGVEKWRRQLVDDFKSHTNCDFSARRYPNKGESVLWVSSHTEIYWVRRGQCPLIGKNEWGSTKSMNQAPYKLRIYVICRVLRMWYRCLPSTISRLLDHQTFIQDFCSYSKPHKAVYRLKSQDSYIKNMDKSALKTKM